MLRRAILLACVSLAAAFPQCVNGDSWFRANPEFVRRYSLEVGDRRLSVSERLESLRDLRILFTVYGAENSKPALVVLRKVQHESGDLGRQAKTLLNDLQTALKRRDKRLPDGPVVLGTRDPATLGIVR